MDVSELLTVETSVLRTYCLTVNSESSELKRRINDNLAVDDFYFPITKSVFEVVSTMSSNGVNVDPSSLEQALSRRSVDVPDDFFLEDLFAGEAPSTETLMKWIESMCPSAENGGDAKTEAAAAPPKEHSLEKTHPSATPRPETQTGTSSAAGAAQPDPAPTPEPKSTPAPSPPSPAPTLELEEDPSPEESSDSSMSVGDVLAPESGAWLGYLAELTKKQGEHLKTGFTGLDAEWGGLGPGLLLLAGEDRERLVDFLKQLVDQIAIRCRVPCLYLSFERSKAELRLQTLSRLSKAPAMHIREGRFDKDSPEWQSIIRAGEHAVEWLQRIYIVEPTPGVAVSDIRELRKGLMDSGAGATCMIAVDNLQKLASESDLLQSVAELKELAESLGIVVIGVADSVELVHERSADMSVKFIEEDGVSVLEVHVPGATKPTVLRFDYDRETHRFEERL